MSEQLFTIHLDQELGKINRNIYGHFAEHLGRGIYEGIWVGEDSSIPNKQGIRLDVVEALREINIPVLRWPGGCFADEYHWKDGIGPRSERKRMVNTHWGGTVENNHFGTHEFMMLCEMLGCEPYICGNVGSGTIQEMSEWVEYMTFEGESPMADWRKENGRDLPWSLTYFGVGNESWGCGGNMTPEYYADLYRRYQTYVRNYGENKIYKIAGGANTADYHWTEVLMKNAGDLFDGLSLHYYTITGESWHEKGSATNFTENEWQKTMEKAFFMKELLSKHGEIMDKYDPEKRVGLIIDEWGTWFDVEEGTNPGFLYQQNTIRDALITALHFHIFQEQCERVQMANIAQTVNVLQAMILTKEEKLVLTPTYHIFDMFKGHQDGKLLSIEKREKDTNEIPQISISASKGEAGEITISLCNLDLHEETVCGLKLPSMDIHKKDIKTKILTAAKMNAHNTFEDPNVVVPSELKSMKMIDNTIEVILPPMSVVVLTIL